MMLRLKARGRKTQMHFKPNEIQIPGKYRFSCAAVSWFTAGWNDQMNGRKGPDEADLRRHQGDDVWEAYSEGRKAAAEALEQPVDVRHT